MTLLCDQVAEGADMGYILDQVARARAAFTVRDTSRATYSSHLRCIVAVCDALWEPVLPAGPRMLRRYTAVINNAVTLRGHLAAWRLLHTVFGEPWAGLGDPLIRAAQAGLTRLPPARQARMAIRKEIALRVAVFCFQSAQPELLHVGIMVALAYLYALRVPSELLRQ